MKTIVVSDKQPTLKEVLKLASEENIILKTIDGKEFVVAETDDFNKEIELVRQNADLMQLLDERSKEKETYSLNQIKQQLNLK